MRVKFMLRNPLITCCGKMSLEVRLDERGRVTIPREIRNKLGLKPGERLLVKVQGNSIVLTRAKDPFKIIESILKDLTFERSLRFEAEKQALRELKVRHEGK